MSWLSEAAAVLASAAVFGVAHVYLGWGGGVLRATVVGVVLGVAYLLTGTLWVPIVLHAVVDVTSGLTGSVALEQDAPVTCQSMAGGEGGSRWRPNKGMKLTTPGELRSFAACPQC